jgi:hypothetical protein
MLYLADSVRVTRTRMLITLSSITQTDRRVIDKRCMKLILVGLVRDPQLTSGHELAMETARSHAADVAFASSQKLREPITPSLNPNLRNSSRHCFRP